MKIIAKIGFWLSIASIMISVIMVLINPEVRRQAFALDFPLYTMGEKTLFMVLPILLSFAATIACLIGIKNRYAQYGLFTTIISWLILYSFLGNKGFQYIF